MRLLFTAIWRWLHRKQKNLDNHTHLLMIDEKNNFNSIIFIYGETKIINTIH